MYRMYRRRSYFLRLRSASLMMQAGWRAMKDRTAYEEERRRRGAAVSLQRIWRGQRDRRRYLAMVQSAVLIQVWGRATRGGEGLTSIPHAYMISFHHGTDFLYQYWYRLDINVQLFLFQPSII